MNTQQPEFYRVCVLHRGRCTTRVRLPLLLLLATISSPILAVESTIVDLTARAQFIFQGTIVKANGTTIHTVAVNQPTAIVHVDEIIDSTDAFSNLRGKNITIALRAPNSLHDGDKRTFFATSWLFADSVAVREIGSVAEGPMATSLASETVKSARQQLLDAQLASRLATAEQVVQGEVISVAPLVEGNPPPHSEHDPQWWLATIHPTAVLKGKDDSNVIVAYPSSTDVAWLSAPKFSVGQSAIWILHRPSLPPTIAPKHLTALEPGDVQPASSLDRVRALSQRVK